MVARKGYRVEVNSEGVLQLLNSPEVWADLRARGERVRAALPSDGGEEWAVRDSQTDRAGVVVVSANDDARRAAAAGALLNALYAGGD